MHIFDTNIFLWAFLQDDAHAEKSLSLITQTQEKILIPHLIFAEVVTVLSYKSKDPRAAHAFIDYIANHNKYTVFHTDIASDTNFWRLLNKRIAYQDAVVIKTALEYNAILHSFDEEVMRIRKQYHS